MLNKQIGTFVFVGIVNTIVGYSLYAVFIFLGFNYTWSVLFSTVLGCLFNFKSIGKFVFNNSNNRKILKFLGVYGVVFIVNISVIKIFVFFGFNNYVSGLIAIFPASIISFILNKHYVFKEKNYEVN